MPDRPEKLPEKLPGLLVDAEWVAAQRAAGADDPSPHPLLEPEWVDPTRPWEREGRSGVEWYFADPEHRLRSPHPLLALATLEEQLPQARAHPLGPLAAWLQHVDSSPDAVVPGRPGAPELTLGRLRELALAALRGADPSGPVSVAVSVTVSVVLTVGSDSARTVNWVRSVGEAAAAGADVELVAVAGPLRRSHRVLAGTVAAAYGVGPLRHHDGPGGTEAGVAASSGDRVVLVRAGVVPDAAAALRLAAVLDDVSVAAVQPLLLDRADVVVSAGGIWTPDGLEAHLHGHAARDAEVLGRLDLPTLVSPVVALARATWDAAGGTFGSPLDEADLGLRVGRRGRVVLEPTVRMTWASGGLPGTPAWARARARFAEGRTPPAATALPAPPVRARIVEGAPRLRWTIDTAAAAGAAGETWGDLHFARALAAALERRGQHVAVDPAPARDRWSRELDDVVLVVRGLDRVEPRPGPLHVLWVISHPELVSADEVAAYSAVFAASLTWAAERSTAWGVPVEPLLQCTDPAVFHPGLAEPDTGPAVLFVGNSRGAPRPALAGALAAGVEVTVHGAGWAALLPELEVSSRQVPNAELGRLYAAAGVVLNDHWEDMRRAGFVSNRLFDAAACGARVLSDDVAGAAELFDGLVRTFADPGQVGGVLAEVPTGWPAYAERVRLAERVARKHSFDRRAETLLDAVARRL